MNGHQHSTLRKQARSRTLGSTRVTRRLAAVVAGSGTTALVADFDELRAQAIAWSCSSRTTPCKCVSYSVSFAPVVVVVHGLFPIPHSIASFHDVKSVPNKGGVNIRHVL